MPQGTPLLERLGRFTPFVRKAELHQGPTLTAAERNVRVPVSVAPQAAPDPPRQGFVPSRPAMVQVAVFAYDMGHSLDDPRFQAPNLEWSPVIARPAGRQTPHTLRQNIVPAQHMAYGSLLAMNYQPNQYR